MAEEFDRNVRHGPLLGEDVNAAGITERTLDKYLEKLKYRSEDFKNNLILELGSGFRQRAAREIEDKIPSSKVICVDYSLKDQYRRDMIKGGKPMALVSAYFSALPFKENIFDKVISMFGVPFYFSDAKAMKKAFDEIIRVLKPGGEARLFPAKTYPQDEPDKKARVNILEDVIPLFAGRKDAIVEVRDEYVYISKP